MTANSVSSVVPALQSTGLGVPLSYQRTATRTNLNPPPPPPRLHRVQNHAKTTDLYHHQEGSRDAAEIANMVNVSPSGEIGEKFQVHLVADPINFVSR